MVIAITQNAHYTNDLEPNYLQSKDNFKAPQPEDSYGCSTDIWCTPIRVGTLKEFQVFSQRLFNYILDSHFYLTFCWTQQCTKMKTFHGKVYLLKLYWILWYIIVFFFQKDDITIRFWFSPSSDVNWCLEKFNSRLGCVLWKGGKIWIWKLKFEFETLLGLYLDKIWRFWRELQKSSAD